MKYLSRHGPRFRNLIIHNIIRRNSSNTEDPCNPQAPCAQSPKPKDPCSPSPAPTSTCPEPPPCPPLPLCPPSICPPTVNSGDPCNYCPPSCVDPDYPDMTKLKKLQCRFQKSKDVPVYLIKGNSDAFLYQLTLFLNLVAFAIALHNLYVITK